jgi:hypothetical protein
MCVVPSRYGVLSVYGVLAHAALAAARARKDVVPFAGQWLQCAQGGHRLARQRHDVLGFHLHALRRDAPLACLKIDLVPLGLAQLARPHEHEWRELEGIAGHV